MLLSLRRNEPQPVMGPEEIKAVDLRRSRDATASLTQHLKNHEVLCTC